MTRNKIVGTVKQILAIKGADKASLVRAAVAFMISHDMGRDDRTAVFVDCGMTPDDAYTQSALVL